MAVVTQRTTSGPMPSTSARIGYWSAWPSVPRMRQPLQAPALGERQEQRPDCEARSHDRRLRQEHDRYGDAGAQQENQDEDAAGSVR